MSAGMVVPDYEARLKQLAERGIRTETKRPVPMPPDAAPPSSS
jgi:hypothetical protein